MANTYKIKNITVRQKIATGDDTYIVCGNSDYTVHWDLDDEWAEYAEKTMLVVLDSGEAYSIQFTGVEAALPALPNTRRCVIGLMAGDVRTTTGAMFVCRPSIRDASGAPVEPPADVYAQLVSQLAKKISEPSQDGTAGQALVTDGKGGRSWGDVASTPDWDQNEPAAKDYVKNRTHWVEPNGAKTEVFPEQSFSATIGTGYQIALEESQIPAVGSNWTAVFDGETYSGTTVESVGAIVCGNLSIKNVGDDTGEPFLVAMIKHDSSNTAAIFAREAGTHTITLSYKTDVVHTIDPKFIKDMYHEETFPAGIICEFDKPAGQYWVPVILARPLTVGVVYTVVRSGISTEVACTESDGKPFLNVAAGNGALIVEDESKPLEAEFQGNPSYTDTYQIIAPEQSLPVTIDPKYLPPIQFPKQVQADWAITDETLPSAILNKPQIGYKRLSGGNSTDTSSATITVPTFSIPSNVSGAILKVKNVHIENYSETDVVQINNSLRSIPASILHGNNLLIRIYQSPTYNLGKESISVVSKGGSDYMQPVLAFGMDFSGWSSNTISLKCAGKTIKCAVYEFFAV